MRSERTSTTTAVLDAANWLAAMLCVLLLVVFLITRVQAAVPASGTVSAATPLVHWGGDEPTTGADSATASNETGCIDTPGSPLRNCDTFKLTVAPGSYSNKALNVSVNWTLPTDEYDLFIHQGPTNTISDPVVASSNHGLNGDTTAATQNSVKLTLPSTVLTPIVYTIHVANAISPSVNGTNTDQYVGNASLVSSVAPRTATYTDANSMFHFSNDMPLKAPVTNSDGEPSSRTDKLGNFYLSGIRGFPAGVDLWYFDLNPSSPTYDPLMLYPQYRGQPDGFTGQASAKAGINAGGDGGGDIDLAVLFPTDGTTPTLAFASLIAANLSTGNTTDKGMNYTLNPVGNAIGGIPANDRQWLEALNGSTVYILYRTLDPVVSQIQQSTDGGIVYGPASTTGQTAQTASLDVDPTDGTVIAGFNDGTVAVGTPSTPATVLTPNPAPLSTDYHTYQAATDPAGVAHIFFQCQVARDSGTGMGKNGKPYGTLYALYSNDTDVFLEHSLDRGVTWSTPVRVNDPATVGPDHPKFNVFPRLALGTTYGSVGIVWYGTNNLNAQGQDDGSVSSNSRGGPHAMWRVFYALTYNATSSTPAFYETTVSNHYNHAGNISEGGLVVTGANPNRNLLDYFEVSFDPQGAAVIGYTDDHNDVSGECFSVRQIAGPSINPGATVAAAAEGPMAARQTLPAAYVTAPIPGPFGAQVTDFVGDESYGLVVTAPATDPLDITAIKYYVVQSPKGPALIARMTVSNLNALGTIPPASTWRMSFAANCPNSILDPTGTYSFGMSDLGDQFYLEVDTSAAGAATVSYGTVARNSDGSLTYTSLGAADSYTFDTTNNIVSARVPLAKLNTYLSGIGHPQIVSGSVLAGLRGSAFDTSGTAKEDSTYGGSQYSVP